MNKQPSKKFVEKMMSHVKEKYSIGARAFTKADFYRICQGEKIRLLKEETENSRTLLLDRSLKGVYIQYPHEDRKLLFIWLRCFHLKRFDLFTAFHELDHHFCLHIYGLRQSERETGVCPQKEGEANYFAELALNKLREAR